MPIATPDDQQSFKSSRLLARKSFRSVLAVALGVAVAFLFQVLLLNFHVILYDEGLSLYGALRVFEGQLPYRDFWTMYPPGEFYLYAAAFHFFGVFGIWDRIFYALFNAVSAVTIAYILQTLTGRRWFSRCVAVAFLIWNSSNIAYGFPIFPAIAFILIATACMLHRWRDEALYWTICAGASLGLAALFRHDLGLYALIALAAASVAAEARVTGTLRSRRIWTDALRLFGMTVLVMAPAVILLLARVPLHDLYYSLFYVPGVIYPRVRSVPFPSLAQTFHGIFHLGVFAPFTIGPSLGDGEYNIVWLPLLTLATALPWLITQLRQRSADRWKTTAYLALFLLTGLLFVKGIVRVSPLHLTPSIVPAFLLIAILLADFETLQNGVRIALVFTVFWALLCSAGATRRAYVFAHTNIHLLLYPHDPYGSFAQACHPPAGLERAKCLFLDPNEQQAILYVESRTAPSERIFVGVPRYDVLFDNDISFYFFSGRDSATKWHDLHPGVETTAPIQAQIVADLERNHVRYVVEDEWPIPHEHNASATSSGVMLLSDYIRKNYAVERNFDSIEIFRRVTPFASEER